MEYLLKACTIITIFYGCYKLFLQRDTFFQSNRWFLLIGLITAFTLPFVVIPIYIEYTPMPIQNFVISESTPIEIIEEPFNIWHYAFIVYALGIVIFSMRFLVQLVSLALLIIKNKKHKQNGYTFIETQNETPPFSFLKWIVYNPNQFNKTELQHIIAHEKVHVKQYHSIDIIISQLAAVVFWFNPITWFYKKDLQQNLEFIADFKAQNQTHCKKSYQHLLLKTSVPSHQMALTNNFYNSLIKKRIVMLQKSKSKKRNLLKYALVLPFLTVFLMSFNTEEVYVAKTETQVEKLNTNKNIETNTLEAFEIKKEETSKNLNLIKEQTSKLESNKLENNKPVIKKSILIISGTVTNTEGKGLYGADIIIEGTKSGASTGFDGSYSINASKGDVLIFSYEGMATQKIKATKNKIDAVLITSKKEWETEFKVGKPMNSNINQDSINKSPWVVTVGVNAENSLNNPQNKLIVGQPINEIEPIYILDGKEINQQELQKINNNNIESISVLKDANATTKYGDRAKDGVVLIKSKKANAWKISSKRNSNVIFATKDTIYVNEKPNILKGIQSNFEQQPLYIVDGKEVTQNEFTAINEQDIESISVLKDDQGKEKYGKKGEHGVVLIKMKTENSKTPIVKVIGYGNGTGAMNKALIIIDGKEDKNKKVEDLNPNNIESLNVLKGNAATKKYGEKAKNGAIEITTKKKK